MHGFGVKTISGLRAGVLCLFAWAFLSADAGRAEPGKESADSSVTRVRPIFKKLVEQDPTGQKWLGPLLDLGTRARQAAIPDDLGRLEQGARFEFGANPPKSFLEWLLEHGDALQKPDAKSWDAWSAVTRQKRQKLFEGDQGILAEALYTLRCCTKLPERAWWRLEGVTRVDCALITPSTVIFVEGKRTEMGASKEIIWYPKRNQVLRNLDCAAEFARQTGRPNYFVLLVVEKPIVEADPLRQQEIKAIINPGIVSDSLPHLSRDEREELLRHYLGYTTWQDIVETFKLPKALLEN